MTYKPVTPFRRTVDSRLMEHERAAREPLPAEGVNKWEILRELTHARSRIGVTDRALGVLQALISFHPNTILGGNDHEMIVHPSNVAISERLNGMPASTIRRHIAVLVKAGIVVRRDSPNGKRFARHYGGEKEAFGFDLSPLVLRKTEICAAAEAERAEKEQFARLRRGASLMRRDLAGLVDYGLDARPDQSALWERLSSIAVLAARSLRRKLDTTELEALAAELEQALNAARDILEPETRDMSANDVHSERHIQNSNTQIYDSEPYIENEGRERHPEEPDFDDAQVENVERPLPNVPLTLVLAVCAELKVFYPDKIRHWHQFVQAVEVIRPQMGISPSAWQDAVRVMGPEEAAVVVAAMLERYTEIKSPGGYLRHLTDKAEEGRFSCGPMIMALLRKDAA
jgi:replication initiation protein RepC